jgi:hypothetical protein
VDDVEQEGGQGIFSEVRTIQVPHELVAPAGYLVVGMNADFSHAGTWVSSIDTVTAVSFSFM